MACAIADEESMRLLRLAADLRLQCRVDEAIATLDAALESLPEGARLRAEELKAQLLYEAPLFVALAKWSTAAAMMLSPVNCSNAQPDRNSSTSRATCSAVFTATPPARTCCLHYKTTQIAALPKRS